MLIIILPWICYTLYPSMVVESLGCPPFLRVELKTKREEILRHVRKCFRDWWGLFLLGYLEQCLEGIREDSPRRQTCSHLDHSAPETPNIRLTTIAILLHYLRSHPVGCTTQRGTLLLLNDPLQLFTTTKIYYVCEVLLLLLSFVCLPANLHTPFLSTRTLAPLISLCITPLLCR